VIRVGDPPQIIAGGITVTYAFATEIDIHELAPFISLTVMA
jgi:hypothetical protein